MNRSANVAILTGGGASLLVFVACEQPRTDPRADLASSIERSFQRSSALTDETVTFELHRSAHGATRKYVRRANGRLDTYGDYITAEREAYRIRFGNLSPRLVDQLEAMPSGSSKRVLMIFDRADNASTQRALRERGVELDASPNGRIVFASMTRDELQAIRHLPGITRIDAANTGGTGLEFSPPSGPGNSLTSARIDTRYNQALNGGRPPGTELPRQRIGIVEDPGCRLFSQHEAMSGLNLTTQGDAFGEAGGVRTCFNDTPCDTACNGLCINSECIDPHASRVWSAMAHRVDSGVFGAHQAEFFHPTVGEGSNDIKCTDDFKIQAYEWLRSRGVTTVVESFGCENPNGADGITQDFYAREYDIAFFRAAGVTAFDVTAPGCLPANAICVGGFDTPTSMSASSNGENPNTARDDREEPDIVALARDVDVIDVTSASTSNWTTRNGTSYASPAMGALGAMTKQGCDGELDHKALRAMMMATAWSYNPEGDPYSTPLAHEGASTFLNRRDGAGGPIAHVRDLFCGEPNAESPFTTTGGIFTINVNGTDGDPLPAWMIEPGGQIGTPTPRTEGATPNELGDIVGRVAAGFENVPGGNRLRVTLSWDACPSSAFGLGPSNLSADLDLFAVDFDTEQPIFSARSFDDNNEGFDIILPEGEARNIAFVVSVDPRVSSTCGENADEPYALYAVHGPPGAFETILQ
ncbi:MAG: S8 family serine peptidase [Myxococcota bacterium]